MPYDISRNITLDLTSSSQKAIDCTNFTYFVAKNSMQILITDLAFYSHDLHIIVWYLRITVSVILMSRHNHNTYISGLLMLNTS